MKTILTPDARSRLASLNLVNPELTTRVKTHLATLSNDNKIATPVNDQQLKRILGGLSKDDERLALEEFEVKKCHAISQQQRKIRLQSR